MADDVKILGMPPESGRWLLIIIGTIIELCLGAVYAYSIISVPLKKIFTDPVATGGFGLNVSAMQMSLPYIASLAFFALTMPLVGKYIEKYGPRKVGMLGGVIVGMGWILGSMATSPMMLMILYGVIAGIGVGIAYNCPITTAARWFPDKRGLAVGLTLLGFGFSAFITGKMSDILSASFGGVFASMKILGIAFLVLIVVLSMFLVFPPAGWCPAGWKPPVAAAGAKKTDYMRDEMVKTSSFKGLWICYVIGALAGLMAIGVAKPAGLEVAANAGLVGAGVSATLTNLVLPFAFCNAVGRPIFGTLTDKLTPPKTAILSYVIIIAASLLMYTNPASMTIYTVSFALLWLCLGGWLAIAPAATAGYFGTKDYARNYGLLFTAYGLGAIIGNLMAGAAKDMLGGYVNVFPYVAVLAALGIVVAFVMVKPPKTA
jgi:OFA family oxalate/formate antiporter-like MFS transporter